MMVFFKFKNDVVLNHFKFWRDTIYVGMAGLNTIKKTYAKTYAASSERRKAQIAQEFTNLWCKNSVFCAAVWQHPSGALPLVLFLQLQPSHGMGLKPLVFLHFLIHTITVAVNHYKFLFQKGCSNLYIF